MRSNDASNSIKSRCKLWIFNKLSKHWVSLWCRSLWHFHLSRFYLYYIFSEHTHSFSLCFRVVLIFLPVMFIYRLNFFCVLFVSQFLFCGCMKLLSCLTSSRFIVEWLSTSTTVYHCRKWYLVELLLRLAHKQENE